MQLNTLFAVPFEFRSLEITGASTGGWPVSHLVAKGAQAILPGSRWANHDGRLYGERRFLRGGEARSAVPEKLVGCGPFSPYDLAPDGKRFAVVLYPDGTAEQGAKPLTSITLILNFFDELRRRVPAASK